MIVVYAILATRDSSKQLKADVMEAIGEHDLNIAKDKLSQIIKDIHGYSIGQKQISAEINAIGLDISILANNPDPKYKIDPTSYEVDIPTLPAQILKKNPKRPVALLDVDLTLLSDSNEINDSLLNALAESGIRDIYLFTNMDLGDLSSKVADPSWFSRSELIVALTERNFIVHGVITPADPIYSKGLSAAYDDLYVPQAKRVANGAVNESNYSQDPAFQKAKQDFVQYNSKTSEIYRGKNEKTPKGEMYRYFVDNKPDWVDSMVVVDDSIDVLEDVRKTHNEKFQYGPPILTTINVNKNAAFDTQNYKVPIASHLEQLTDKAESLDKIRFNLFKQELKNTYTSSWKLFKRSNMLDAIDKGEITSIKDVRKRLDSPDNKNKYQRSRSILSKIS